MSVNVNRDVSDAYYRYKMPKIQSKIEGKGNGIKTVVPNMVEVSKAIGRPPEYPTKFFGCELGSQTTMDSKTGRYIVNGAHDANKLAELLDGFIKKFVLCSSCGNPETVMTLKGKSSEKDIYLTCKACGKTAMVDMTHKLCNYIRNNPPPSSEFKNQAQASKVKTIGDVGDASSASATATPAKSSQEDTSEEFAAYLVNGDHTAVEIALEASKLDIDEERMGLIVVQVLLGENIMTQFSKQKALLADLAKSTKAQKGLIGGVERIVGVTKPELLPKINGLLKGFYDNDIIEESVILEWHEKNTKKYTGDRDIGAKVRAEANAFVDWLKNAEEESD